MARRVGNTFTILALCCAIGVQWLGIQSIAWAAMLVENSKHGSFCHAFSQTFDGAHPCSLCHFVNHAKNSEKKSDVMQTATGVDLISCAEVTRLVPRVGFIDYPLSEVSPNEVAYSPPAPPPRPLLA
jgi:hypothetical protein